jgi:hypothetical protein
MQMMHTRRKKAAPISEVKASVTRKYTEGTTKVIDEATVLMTFEMR